jgi:hypothetical protein
LDSRVLHTVLADLHPPSPYEELWKLKYFTMQKYNLEKILEKNQNPSRYYHSLTNLKFQNKPKYHLSKILI